MQTHTWHTFIRKIYIDAPMQAVYDAWATSEGIMTWFLRSCELTSQEGIQRTPKEPAQPGDTYAWEWYNWSAREEGKILEANGIDRLSFVFGGPVVTLELSRDRNMTLLSLTQSEIPEDDQNKMNVYYGCGTGWTFWLANLKVWLEHDILIHEANDELMGKHDGLVFVNM